LRLALGIIAEDILGVLFRLEEARASGRVVPVGAVMREALSAGPAMRWAALIRLRMGGHVTRKAGQYRLTELGRQRAATLVRSHRLWESYLARHLPLATDHLHRPADEIEHYLTAPIQQALARELRDQGEDPHGRPIPGRSDK